MQNDSEAAVNEINQVQVTVMNFSGDCEVVGSR